MDQQLLVFVTVAEKESFSRAAEQLHMTQPAVSQHIQALEREFGTRLLERSNKYVRLNKAGEIVYHHAKEILGLHTRMRDLVDDLMNTPSGNLIIGASYTFGEYVLPHVVARLRDRYPKIKPTITIHNTKEIVELIAGRQLDAGIVEGECRHEKLSIEPFADDEMQIIVSSSHRLAKKVKVTVEELEEETWIVREEGSGTREAAEKMFARLGLSPANLMEFGSTQIIKESVEAGTGVSLLSSWAIRKELTLGSLSTVKLSETPIMRKFSLVTQANPFRTKALDIFLDLLRKNDVLPDSLERK
ncbi:MULTISPECIES: LysR family transcriptional regulator [Brevibacillus]|jgi:DNA-binding transcriptional LysR family regulator|uniref:LysR family transcriptional regulator n=1 Tax=Brevibacillus TaxID=55080 RepID=UPI00046A56FB|nr:LysR family transcriptional regulator [Brevibacillus borstelensis]MBE5395224.1 LysR family transcriptional regulator [Brevibacillus borstelensis]MED1742917.1 LysR family transcriptional regulator [Brevibacillus borstelensis]MED1851375.1 LysR family transcriptional regulator [Brevibacillus borstelensis]MED1875816.1 LysR family transcriptional regulator [Brevibacillus borstelensis]MED2007075.1 LysR family transcriptional regulator [Brevibacillus borstelensis]